MTSSKNGLSLHSLLAHRRLSLPFFSSPFSAPLYPGDANKRDLHDKYSWPRGNRKCREHGGPERAIELSTTTGRSRLRFLSIHLRRRSAPITIDSICCHSFFIPRSFSLADATRVSLGAEEVSDCRQSASRRGARPNEKRLLICLASFCLDR